MLPPPPPAWVEARPLQPHFWDFHRLAPGEQRLLEATVCQPDVRCALRPGFTSSETVPVKCRTGQALYAELMASAPVLLANFLNQTAALGSRRFSDGHAALEYVRRVERFEPDRLFLEVDPTLKAQVAANASWRYWRGTAYIGPEFAMLHGEYSECFRENRAWTSQQLSFAPGSGYTRLDVDLDEEGPTAGEAAATWAHLARVALTHAWPANGSHMETDAIDMGRRLRNRGIAPHYDLLVTSRSQ